MGGDNPLKAATPHSIIAYSYLNREVKKVNTQFIVDETGAKTAVILPLEEYEEMLEDIHDLAIIAERKDEPNVSLEEIQKRLKADGLI
jgi:PHD/YefM family antitoxin component YafN of YafNO toxin-antitoxin module